jgi:hypothetical protein
MSLENLLQQTDLGMNPSHVKAFFLGALSADKPLPFNKTLDELFAEGPEARDILEKDLKELYDALRVDLGKSLSEMFTDQKDIRMYVEAAHDQLDHFLTALSLAGTTSESALNEETADLIDELEVLVEDLEDFIADEDADDKIALEMKNFLSETWEEFVASKR